jgi:ABC-type lipoprotein export system ATPase subunit
VLFSFKVDMRPGASHYFYFLGTLIALECVGQALGRLLCAVFRKQVTANAMSSIVILIFGTVGGFMPSYTHIHPILRWLSWLTPVSFAFEGLMINQFLNMTFDDSVLSITTSSVETVTIGGSQWLSLYDLPRIEFAPDSSIKVFNIFILFLFAIVYDLLGQRLIEKNRAWFFNQTRLPTATVKDSFSMTVHQVVPLAGATTAITHDDGTKVSCDDENGEHVNWPQNLCVKDLCYDVPMKRKVNVLKKVRKAFVHLSGHAVGTKSDVSDYEKEQGKLRLLNKVNAIFSRGRVCALMGTSGAGGWSLLVRLHFRETRLTVNCMFLFSGKTTLMDVIAGYKTGGSISGGIYIDGCKKDEKQWKKISGYAEQNDILNPYLTTLETVRFTAACRLPKTKNRQMIVDRVLNLMNLEQWNNVIVGREVDGEGLPKHARKRLTIAIQLVIEPKILFLVREELNICDVLC